MKWIAIAAMLVAAPAAALGPNEDFSTRQGCLSALNSAMSRSAIGRLNMRALERAAPTIPPDAAEHLESARAAIRAEIAAQEALADAIFRICATYPD